MNPKTLHRSIDVAKTLSIHHSRRNQGGFALTLAMGLGFVMIVMGTATLMLAQSDRNTAKRRDTAGASLFAAEGGIARSLAKLTKVNNSVLLTRNYDLINPGTGKNYLGADGISNSRDENTTAADGWTTLSPVSSCSSGNSATPNMCYSGTISANSTYTLLAYRYNSNQKTGTLLVKGQQGSSNSIISVTFAVISEASDFPGAIFSGKSELVGRKILGSNGNIFYDPAVSANTSLTGSAAVGDLARPNFLNALKSGSNDGFTTDNISGRITAQKITPTLSFTPQGTQLGTIKFTSTFGSSSGATTYYQVNKIELKNSEVVTFDTTNGPIVLFVSGDAKMADNAKIRNTRTDGLPPRVGDLRIIFDKFLKVQDAVCVQTAFLYIPNNKLELAGTADGCPSPGESSIDGVVWADEVATTSGNLSGISVPNDVSSLSDILSSVNLPQSGRSRIGSITNWQRVLQ